MNRWFQLADVFAGLGAFSRMRYADYASWVRTSAGQQSLLTGEVDPADWSGSDRERFQVLRSFNAASKDGRFRVSLDQSGGFRTMHPSSPVNFW
jgi:hypothetical protein